MRASFVVLLAAAVLAAGTPLARADHKLTTPEHGFALTVPDAWRHDPSDTFGFLIRPAGDRQKKIRIHPTGHKDVPPDEAARLGAEKIREVRTRQKQRQEAILSSEELVTDSGLKGHAVEVGDEGGSSHLTRIYFQSGDGRIICVCIYHYGDTDFRTEARERVVRTLTAASPAP